MASLNQVMLIGNVGQDVEIRTIPSGARVAQFSLATTRRWKDKNGVEQEHTNWHRLVIWEDSAKGAFKFVERFVGKGDRLFIQGSIEYRQYQDKDGVTKYATEIRVFDVQAAGGLSGTEAGQGQRGGGQRTRTREMAGATSGAGAGNGWSGGGGAYDDFQAPPLEEDDDLPF